MDFSLQFPSSSSNTNPRQKALILIRLVSSTISMDFLDSLLHFTLRAAIDKRKKNAFWNLISQSCEFSQKVSFFKIASEASKLEFSAEFQIRVWSKNE